MKAKDALKEKKWAVVGDVSNPSKFAHDIAEKLIEKEHRVFKVDPRGSDDPTVLKGLKEIPEKVDMVNLVVSPDKGINIVKEMKDLDLKKVFIQPGASSQEILDYCSDNDIEVTKGCVLAEYRNQSR